MSKTAISVRLIGVLAIVVAFVMVLFGNLLTSVVWLAAALAADLFLIIMDKDAETITQMIQGFITKPLNMVLLIAMLVIAWWVGGPVIAAPMLVGAVLGHILGRF
jgi:hypothetical protein